MKSLTFFVLAILSSLCASAQCYTSGSPIAYVWVDPAGRYVDFASDRPMNETHHKIFDLTTGKYVTTGTMKFSSPAIPIDGYNFAIESETRYRQNDHYLSGMKSDNLYVTKDGEKIFEKAFAKYSRVSYDTAHQRGFVIEPGEKDTYQLWWIVEGREPELIDKRWEGADAHYKFSPDGKYAVADGIGAIMDMESRTVLKTELLKDFSLSQTTISLDSREVAFMATSYKTSDTDYLVFFDLATQKLVRQQEFKKEKGKTLFIIPLPDMERSIMYIIDYSEIRLGPQNAWLVTSEGLTPFCNPTWQRERDELAGNITWAYDEAAKTENGCPMEVAAMEAEGKWNLSIGSTTGTLYLSARASGEASGTYSYSVNGGTVKGRLSGTVSTSKNGTVCTNIISATYDESLFDGEKGTITLTLSPDGKSLSGTANGTVWKAQKN